MNGLYPSEFRDKTYVVPLFTRSSAHEILCKKDFAFLLFENK